VFRCFGARRGGLGRSGRRRWLAEKKVELGFSGRR